MLSNLWLIWTISELKWTWLAQFVQLNHLDCRLFDSTLKNSVVFEDIREEDVEGRKKLSLHLMPKGWKAWNHWAVHWVVGKRREREKVQLELKQSMSKNVSLKCIKVNIKIWLNPLQINKIRPFTSPALFCFWLCFFNVALLI